MGTWPLGWRLPVSWSSSQLSMSTRTEGTLTTPPLLSVLAWTLPTRQRGTQFKCSVEMDTTPSTPLKSSCEMLKFIKYTKELANSEAYHHQRTFEEDVKT